MISKKLKFKSLKIDQRDWGKRELVGTISFSSDHADVNLHLQQEHIERIMEMMSQRMLEVAQEVSDELLADIIEALPNPDLLETDKLKGGDDE